MKPLSAKKAGYAIPLVLAGVMILTLTFAVAINALVNLKAETRHALDRAEFERAAMSAENRLAFLMTTEPFGAASLDIGSARQQDGDDPAAVQALATVMLDDRPYAWSEFVDSPKAYQLQVQDEAGLVNVYIADAQQLRNLFTLVGGVDEESASYFGEALEQYFAVPENLEPIRRASEIQGLGLAMGLDDAVQPRYPLFGERSWTALSERLTAHPDNREYNINTAPADVLMALFEMSEVQALEIVEMRQGQVLTNLADIGVAASDATIDYAFPSGRVRFTMADPQSGLIYRSNLVLTPGNEDRPIWIENSGFVTQGPAVDLAEQYPAETLEPFPGIPAPNE
jgi:hypothetical protein